MKKFFALAILVGGFAFAASAQTATTAQQPAPTKSCCKKEGATAGCSKSGAQSTAATPTKSCCKSGSTASTSKSCCKSGATATSCNKTASASAGPAPEPTTQNSAVSAPVVDKKK